MIPGSKYGALSQKHPMKSQLEIPVEWIQVDPSAKDIAAAHRSELNEILNRRLASAVDLQTRMMQERWRMSGPAMTGLREMFDMWRWLVEAQSQAKE